MCVSVYFLTGASVSGETIVRGALLGSMDTKTGREDREASHNVYMIAAVRHIDLSLAHTCRSFVGIIAVRETVFDGVLKACIIWCVSHVTFREMHGMILYILPPASY